MDVIYEVRNLSYSYPGSQRQVLSGANLTLGRGEVLSILGPNGAGKSTLLNCMAGLLHPTAGDIELCGKSIHAMKQREIARQVAYVQQNHVPSFSYSVFEFVLMGQMCIRDSEGIGLDEPIPNPAPVGSGHRSQEKSDGSRQGPGDDQQP